MESMQPKVGIIIPAYNVESYISRAMEACINQTYQNIETIVVDDGSSDGTYDVVKKYSEKDERIKLFRQENGGVSSARNRALDICTSDYVMFLDADDWLEPDTVEKFLQKYKEGEGQRSLISSGYWRVYINEERNFSKVLRKSDEKDAAMNSEEALLCAVQRKCSLGSVCCKLFSAEIINECNLRFDGNISYGEDGLFVFEYLKKVDRLIYIAEPKWNVLERQGSAMRQPYKSKRMSGIAAIEKELDYEDNGDELCRELKKARVASVLSILNKALVVEPMPEDDILFMRKKLRENFREYMTLEKRINPRLRCIFGTYCPCELAKRILRLRNGKRCAEQ